MKITKFDIGGEIISILTRGMYPDPKDAIREYIQNGIDAQSSMFSVKVGQNSVVIQDDGKGMDQKTMRKAVRIGVSDKIPSKNVGFMGIGIYSSFHLCDKLTIFSNTNSSPNKLSIDFYGMRKILEKEMELRLNSQINSDEITDLQTLLEKHLYISIEGELQTEDYPKKGTRVEMTGISPSFYSEISDFEKLSSYIEEVIPLRFDTKKFKWGNLIEDHITSICENHNAKFELIDINLQVHNKSKKLFKPYYDYCFSNSNPQEPIFKEIMNGDLFFGVAWGCLNSIRRKISNKNLRGFLLKKQGFALGKRENLIKYFPRGNTYFDRYIGEIIVVHDELLPNASRSDLEYSGYRTLFYDLLTKIAEKYDERGKEFQEQEKAEEELGILKEKMQMENRKYNESEENPEELINQIVRVKKIIDEVGIRLKSKIIKDETKESAKELKKQAISLEKSIQNKIILLSKIKRSKKGNDAKTTVERAKDLSGIDLPKAEVKNYESIIELFEDLDIELNEEIKKIFQVIDERFIQAAADNKKHYYQLLNDLKNILTE